MVNDRGQLYTIEGLAAGLIMIATAYIVLGATVVYTPGDTHIADMQLETLGTDVLVMMDTPAEEGGASSLRNFIENDNRDGFHDMFRSYCNARTGDAPDDLQFNATISYRSEATVSTYHFNSSREMTGREHSVRVTRWVEVDNSAATNPYLIETRPMVVLVEVLVWRA